MKIVRYTNAGYFTEMDDAGNLVQVPAFGTNEIPWSEEAEKIAASRSHDGQYEIVEVDG